MAAGYLCRFAWPIVIDSTCDRLTVKEGAGLDLVVDVPDGTYYWRGDGTAADFCAVLKTALEAVGGLTYTVTFASTGLLTIQATGAWTLRLTVAHDFPAALLGFVDAVDYASLTGAVTGTQHVDCAWLPQQIHSEDSEDLEASEAVPTYLEGGTSPGRVAMYGDRSTRTILLDALPTSETLVASEAVVRRSFQRFYRAVRDGTIFEYCHDRTIPGAYTRRQILDPAWLRGWPATRTPRTIQRWDVRVPMTLVP